MGPTRENPVSEPLAKLQLDNNLYIKKEWRERERERERERQRQRKDMLYVCCVYYAKYTARKSLLNLDINKHGPESGIIAERSRASNTLDCGGGPGFESRRG